MISGSYRGAASLRGHSRTLAQASRLPSGRRCYCSTSPASDPSGGAGGRVFNSPITTFAPIALTSEGSIPGDPTLVAAARLGGPRLRARAVEQQLGDLERVERGA